jgi:S-methylmethionine-dependent homocysteine/selenocysteine methylase
MTKNFAFLDFYNNTPCIVLNGGMGTELQRRGYQTKLPLWSASANIDAPELVEQIHKDYYNAGADICITNTFRTTPRAFSKASRASEVYTAHKRALEAAHSAKNSIKGREVFIGGSFAPLEDCYEPSFVPNATELAHEHGQLAQWLADDGVDFLLAETINALTEAKAMASAAEATGLPYIVSFVVDPDAKLLDGTLILDAIKETNGNNCIGFGINCRPIDVLDSAYSKLASYKGNLSLYPNGIGRPHDDLGWRFDNNEDSIEKFVSTALRWKNNGAKMIGGCCGTTPDYISALAEAIYGTGKTLACATK